MATKKRKQSEKGDTRRLTGAYRYNVTEFIRIWNSVPVDEGSLDLVIKAFVDHVKIKRADLIKSGDWKYEPVSFKRWVLATAKGYQKQGWPLRTHKIVRQERRASVSIEERQALAYIRMLKESQITPEEVLDIMAANYRIPSKRKDKLVLKARQQYIKRRIREELGLEEF